MASHKPKLFRHKPLHTQKDMKAAASPKNTDYIFAHSQTNYHPTEDKAFSTDYFSSPMIPTHGNPLHGHADKDYTDDIVSTQPTDTNLPMISSSVIHHPGYHSEESMQLQSQSQSQSQLQSQSQTQSQTRPLVRPHSQPTHQTNEEDWGYSRGIYYHDPSTESYNNDSRAAMTERSQQEGHLSPPLGQHRKQTSRDGHKIQEVRQLSDNCVLLTPDSRVSSPNQFIQSETTHSNSDEAQPRQPQDQSQGQSSAQVVQSSYESSDEFRIDPNKFAEDQEYEFDFTAYGLSESQAESFKDIFERQLETLYKSVSDEFNSGIYKDDGKKMGIEFVLSYMQRMFCDSEGEDSNGSLGSYAT